MSTPIRRALYGKLSGDSTLNNLLGTAATGYTKSIYHGVAPEGARFPYVLFNKQSGVPDEAFDDPSALDTDIWLIKGVDGPGDPPKSTAPSADAAEAIAARLNVLLNDGSLSISGGTLSYLRRQSDVDYGEVIEGVQYRHAGALYRLTWT